MKSYATCPAPISVVPPTAQLKLKGIAGDG